VPCLFQKLRPSDCQPDRRRGRAEPGLNKGCEAGKLTGRAAFQDNEGLRAERGFSPKNTAKRPGPATARFRPHPSGNALTLAFPITSRPGSGLRQHVRMQISATPQIPVPIDLRGRLPLHLRHAQDAAGLRSDGAGRLEVGRHPGVFLPPRLARAAAMAPTAM
jgi:hypothetical protein